MNGNTEFTNDKLKKTLKNYSPSFGEDFTDKVMNKIFDEETKNRIYDLFPAFKKVLIGGLAATIALLLSVYLTDGNLTIDSLLGLSDLNSDEVLLTLMNL